MDIKKAIEDKNAAFNKAYNQGDAAVCVNDVRMLPPNQPMLRGRKELEEFFQGLIGKVGGTTSNHTVEFGVDGDLAYQVGTFVIEDTKTPEQGKFVEILRRQQDGSWKVSVAIFNSDKP